VHAQDTRSHPRTDQHSFLRLVEETPDRYAYTAGRFGLFSNAASVWHQNTRTKGGAGRSSGTLQKAVVNLILRRRTLGLEVPPRLLAIADEVIE
jgi:hypothetical protein